MALKVVYVGWIVRFVWSLVFGPWPFVCGHWSVAKARSVAKWPLAMTDKRLSGQWPVANLMSDRQNHHFHSIRVVLMVRVGDSN